MKLSEQLKTARFIGIMRRIPPEKILLCAEAFVAGGGEFLEITFDPSDSETLRRTGDAVRAVKRSFPRLHVGCGTVLNISMTDAAADAGAEFIVSPAASEAVIKAAHRREISAIPGAYTPNEILNAYGSGADLVKLFPVLPGGERYVKTVMSPLSHIPFLVTGGVVLSTVRSMLDTGAAAVGAGASVFLPELVERGDADGISGLVSAFLKEIAHGG